MRRSIFFFVIFSFQTILSQSITLRDTTNQYDYIIITVPEFVTSCETFKQHKETVRDFRTLIVDTTQIFAEFDSSSTPQDNIRNFISYAGTFWRESTPKFFLIVGTVKMVPNFPIPYPSQPPIYFHSDYYYCQNIYENDPTTTDFFIGRIPCKDESEIYNYFSKVIGYEIDGTIYSWMNNVLFLCAGDGNLYLDYAFGIASSFPSYIRPFYIAENDTSQYYGTIDSIYKAINQRGSGVVWLLGLGDDTLVGGNTNWIKIEDINGFTNEDKYFVTFSTGRQSAILDTNTNLTQAMMILPDAGSIGGIVFVGYAFWGVSIAFQEVWAQSLFNPNMQSLGEIFNLDSFSSAGIFGYMKKITNLWADPSIKLKYDVTVDISKPEIELPITFTLEQNYPNPFNPSTNIKYQIPELSFVTLKIYDVLGKEVVTIVNKEKPPGSYEVEFDGINLTSGVYFYRLQAGDFVETKKMVLLK